MLTRTLIGCATAALFLGCGRNGMLESPGGGLVAPTDTGSTVASTLGAAIQSAAGKTVNVIMKDACDPDTFDAILGAGACARNGGTTFEKFIEELTKHQSVGAWFLAPRVANVRVGDTFVVTNQGGEEHTFTEVEDFGGGIVPMLNTLAGVPDEAPECKVLEEDDRVKPGGVYTEHIDEVGHEKYQCCIHPWMRLEADIGPALKSH